MDGYVFTQENFQVVQNLLPNEVQVISSSIYGNYF